MGSQRLNTLAACTSSRCAVATLATVLSPCCKRCCGARTFFLSAMSRSPTCAATMLAATRVQASRHFPSSFNFNTWVSLCVVCLQVANNSGASENKLLVALKEYEEVQ